MDNITEVIHGYYPSSVYLPHYVANGSSALSLVAQFAVLWALVLGIASIYICRPRKSVSRADQFAFIWMCFSKWYRFCLCLEYLLTRDETAGCIHLFFESYFVVYHKTLAGSHTLFGQLWKEYSLSDSRYLTSDSFLVSMEAVTAVSPHTKHTNSLSTNTYSSAGALSHLLSHTASPRSTQPDMSCSSLSP